MDREPSYDNLKQEVERLERELEAYRRAEHLFSDLAGRPDGKLSRGVTDWDGYQPPYGDLTKLNTHQTILDAVGPETLRKIGQNSIHLLDTSVAIYEENGDYAFGMFSSGWCQYMDRASRDLCNTEDNREALDSGKWLCHENCWNDSAKEAMRTGSSTDISCVGGIRLYAEPILADGRVIGAVNIGYGTPPTDPATLKRLSRLYGVDEMSLRSVAFEYRERPACSIAAAKRRLSLLANLIGAIVEKYLLEKATSSEKNRLDRIMSSLDTGLSLINQDRTIAWVNKKTQDMFTGKEPVGSACYWFYEDRDCPCDPCPTLKAFETGEVVRAERFNDTSGRWFHIISQPIKGRGGEVLQVLEGITDITERKAKEGALQASAAFLKTLLETLPVPIFYKDREGRYLGANKAFEDFLGRSAGEFIGKTVFETAPTQIAEQYHLKDEELFRRPGKQMYEWKVKRGDGEERTVVFYKATFPDSKGAAAGIVGGILDITERLRAEADRKRVEATMRSAEKMEAVGRLAGGVAHEFNNMLNVILGYTEMSLRETKPGSTLYEPMLEIQKAAERSSELVRQLLGFSRKQHAEPHIISLNQAVKGKLNILERVAGQDIRVRFNAGSNLWRIRMDEAQLQQILICLTMNARDAMPQGGAVTITTSCVSLEESFASLYEDAGPGDYVLLGFGDTGQGMTEETLDRIFEPFFTGKEGSQGTGLGLAMVYGIVRQNRGIIQANSEPGKGTLFNLYFPRCLDLEESDLERSGEENPGLSEEKKTVLIVEDEEQLLNLARKILLQEGYRVLAATQAKEAVRMVEDHEGPIHLLLTDVVMPGMSGLELMEVIKRHRTGVKTLFMSGYSTHAIAKKGFSVSEMELLHKPFSIEEFTDRIRQLLSP